MAGEGYGPPHTLTFPPICADLRRFPPICAAQETENVLQ
jgi:hypothetical protein